MPVENIRLSEQGRNQLATLVRRTKITHRNVLMRWAFCRSLAEPDPIAATNIPLDPSMPPISWDTFAGTWGDITWALLRMRVHADGLPLDEDTLAAQFRLHLHRGLGYLVGDPRVTSTAGLLSLAAQPEDDPRDAWEVTGDGALF